MLAQPADIPQQARLLPSIDMCVLLQTDGRLASLAAGHSNDVRHAAQPVGPILIRQQRLRRVGKGAKRGGRVAEATADSLLLAEAIGIPSAGCCAITQAPPSVPRKLHTMSTG